MKIDFGKAWDNSLMFLKDLKNWQQFMLGLILSFILFVFVAKDSIERYIEKKAELKIETLRKEERIQRQKDSLNVKNANKFWKKAVDDELELRAICDKMEEYFDGETQISVFKLHDHGDVLAPENNPRVTVKWSTLVKIQEAYQNEPVYTGGLWAMQQADEKGFIYMENLEEYPNYWKGREKAFHETIDSKSAGYIFIKDIVRDNIVVSKWYIGIHWRVENPYENPYLVRIKLERFSNLLYDLIYTAPKEFRVD